MGKTLIAILLIGLAYSCKDQNHKISQPTIKVRIPEFNSDSAYMHIIKQIEFGPRRMNSVAHENCKNWLKQKLESNGFKVILQNFKENSYSGELLNGTNIHGVYNPNIKERILLCAHYDTRHIADKDTQNVNNPIIGADDGASGVAVLIEISRLINLSKIPIGIDIIFFDAEDHGSDKPANDYTWGLGSQYWANQLKNTEYEYEYGILLDMVGSKNATFRKEGYSIQSAKTVVNQIWNLAQGMGKGEYFINQNTGFITDDHRFIIEKTRIPMVDIINVNENGSFGEYHHKHSDNIENIDKQTLKAVGQVVTAQVFRESNMENE